MLINRKKKSSESTEAVSESVINENETVQATEEKNKDIMPDEKKSERQFNKKFFIIKLIIIALIVAAGIYLIVPLFDNSKVTMTYYAVDSNKIEEPVRISFLSDLHLAEFGENNADLIEAVRSQTPDIIAMGGDMTTMGETDIHVVVDLCSALSEIAPVYYVFGNHEMHDVLFEDSTLVESLKNVGVHVMWDSYETIEINGNLIDIGGLCEDPKQFEEYGQTFWNEYMESENYRLLLVHDPAYYDSEKYAYTGNGALIGEDVDLALCGHRHGGQIIIPGIGGLYHPDTGLFPNLYGGKYQIENTTVIVSRGLGNESIIPRINNKPELVCIEIL